jgi:hypothetical protein
VAGDICGHGARTEAEAKLILRSPSPLPPTPGKAATLTVVEEISAVALSTGLPPFDVFKDKTELLEIFQTIRACNSA